MNVIQALLDASTNHLKTPENSPSDVSQMVEIQPLWADLADIEAVVTQAIAPHNMGRVKFRGTRWRALSDLGHTLPAGTHVQVIGRHRTSILIVEPMDENAVPALS